GLVSCPCGLSLSESWRTVTSAKPLSNYFRRRLVFSPPASGSIVSLEDQRTVNMQCDRLPLAEMVGARLRLVLLSQPATCRMRPGPSRLVFVFLVRVQEKTKGKVPRPSCASRLHAPAILMKNHRGLSRRSRSRPGRL